MSETKMNQDKEREKFVVEKFVWYSCQDIFRYYDYECNLDSSPDLDDKDAWLIEWLKRAVSIVVEVGGGAPDF